MTDWLVGWLIDPNTFKAKIGWRILEGISIMDGNIPVMHGMPIAALCRQDGLTGSAWGDWAQYTDSPLRAFENELGVQVG